MSKCLLVSQQQKDISALMQLLNHHHIILDKQLKAAKEVLQLENVNDDLIIINTPLADEYGDQLAKVLCNKTHSSIIVLVKADSFQSVNASLFEYGILCIAKPFTKLSFLQTIDIALVLHYRLLNMYQENIRLHKNLSRLQLLDQAKYVLMDTLQMNEAQAHHYIEKQAMDTQKSKIAIANEILKKYARR